MPQHTHEFGKYGARGIKGSQAVARQLDTLANYITSPVTTRRGLQARLHYLTRTPRALTNARNAGLTATTRTIKKWLNGTQQPTPQNLQRIDTAYRTVRRHNITRHLLHRLNNNGHGTRVEIHPLNQSHVPPPHQRTTPHRTLTIRHWDPIIHAWTTNNPHALDTAWTHHLTTLGSQWGQYEYVTNIGFPA